MVTLCPSQPISVQLSTHCLVEEGPDHRSVNKGRECLNLLVSALQLSAVLCVDVSNP